MVLYMVHSMHAYCIFHKWKYRELSQLILVQTLILIKMHGTKAKILFSTFLIIFATIKYLNTIWYSGVLSTKEKYFSRLTDTCMASSALLRRTLKHNFLAFLYLFFGTTYQSFFNKNILLWSLFEYE